MVPTRIRSLLVISLFAPTLACACGDAPLDAAREEATQASAATEAHSEAAYPDYVAEGMTACRDIEGSDGRWQSLSGSWQICRGQRVEQLTGCGFYWSSPFEAPPDVDAVAGAVGRFVRKLTLGGSQLSATRIKHCGALTFPNPGSTPCGACQVGFATPNQLYLSLSAAFDRDTAYPVQLGGASGGVLVVQVPAHQTLVTLPITAPVPPQGVAVLTSRRD